MKKKHVVPATISVVILGAAATGCGPTNNNTDAGEQLCPQGCGIAREADGGYYRTEDGGVQCLC